MSRLRRHEARDDLGQTVRAFDAAASKPTVWREGPCRAQANEIFLHLTQSWHHLLATVLVAVERQTHLESRFGGQRIDRYRSASQQASHWALRTEKCVKNVIQISKNSTAVSKSA